MSTTAVQIPGYVAGTWTIDPIHSGVAFTVRHMIFIEIEAILAPPQPAGA